MRIDYPVSLVEWVLGLFFPGRCLLCGQVVPVGRLFCEECVDELPEEPLCREITLAGNRSLGVCSALPYTGGFRETLHGFKFQGQQALARPIAWLMAEAAGDTAGFDGVAYAPMYGADRQKRGYDQSRLLAKYLAKALGLPLTDALEKARRTQAQHGLGRAARLENPRNAYQARFALTGRRLLLVDDIVTTGSTLRECAQTLYLAGAREVRCVCAADTPPGDLP